MFPLVVSYYTRDTLYCLEAQNLAASCEKWHVPYLIEPIDSFGSWELNCAYKPFFLLEKLTALGQPLLWIDADGVFEQQPEWIEAFGGDLSVRWDQQAPPTCPSKAISSTLFLASTPKVQDFLRLWARETERQFNDPQRETEFWDQVSLRDCLLSHENKLDLRPLPLTYSHIFDHEKEREEMEKGPVIVHYQASRYLKKWISYQRGQS
jgi:hypothetical protein